VTQAIQGDFDGGVAFDRHSEAPILGLAEVNLQSLANFADINLISAYLL
jgi:hypothetical protein